MIEITRLLARRLRTLLRRSAPAGASRSAAPPLVLQAERQGLTVRAQHPEVALQLHLPGVREPDVIALPGAALTDFEGAREVPVVLERTGAGMVQARYDDAGVPQVREYSVPEVDKQRAFPDLPKSFVSAGPGLLRALDEATHCVGIESPRFAVCRIQLRGKPGEVVGTDGRQLLVQRGFTFPWKDDVLVPALSIFGCRELSSETQVEIGRTTGHVCLRIGPWTFWLAVDTKGRFPKTDQHIPARNASATTCRLSAPDAAFLAQALPRLPGGSDGIGPVTVDLNGHVVVRARGEGERRPTELTLSRSGTTGPAVCFVTERRFLTRAAALGLTEIEIADPEQPLVARNDSHIYVWVPLSKDLAVPHSDDALQIPSPQGDTSTPEPQPQPQPRTERKLTPMTSPRNETQERSNGQAEPQTVAANDASHARAGSVIEEAQALKDALHDAYGRASRLVAALKAQRRQSRIVASTLASLRQLQQIDG